MSNPCWTAREGWQKTCLEEETDGPCTPQSHSELISPGNASGGLSQTPGNNVDSDGATFRWSDWSPRVAKLNAPREDGAHLIEPPLRFAAEMAGTNQHTLNVSDCDIQGILLKKLAGEARKQLLAEALRYTRSYRDVEVPACPSKLILAGHQPEMFHPGVWFKNFVLARLAKHRDAVAVNLQIDSDTMKAASVRVPSGPADRPRIENVPFDRAAVEAPWEERSILDRACFESFGRRAGEHLQSLVRDSLLDRYWQLVTERAKETNNVGASLSQARHQCEAAFGLQTLEIPQSRVCDLPAMRWFIAHLLAHLPRLWEVYNSALMEYRREHKVRSAAHPVPELDSVDGWLEAPLWIWSDNQPERRALFVRQRDDELILSDREGIEVVLSIIPEGGASTAVEQLAKLSSQGIRLRTRALITTMAARLLLGDLFVHGIGGAKYDQLTDRIIQRFFGVDPPGYLVVSGTLHLPISHPTATNETAEQIRQRIRELEFQPERFLETGSPSTDQSTAQLIAEKRRLLKMPTAETNTRSWCRAVRQVNQSLQPTVAALRELWTNEANTRANQQRLEAMLGSREYAFPLFPQSILTNFLMSVLEIPDKSG